MVSSEKNCPMENTKKLQFFTAGMLLTDSQTTFSSSCKDIQITTKMEQNPTKL